MHERFHVAIKRQKYSHIVGALLNIFADGTNTLRWCLIFITLSYFPSFLFKSLWDSSQCFTDSELYFQFILLYRLAAFWQSLILVLFFSQSLSVCEFSFRSLFGLELTFNLNQFQCSWLFSLLKIVSDFSFIACFLYCQTQHISLSCVIVPNNSFFFFNIRPPINRHF